MVCQRCKLAVADILNELEIPFSSIDLGTVQLNQKLTTVQKNALSKKLNHIGFEILEDASLKTIEAVKKAIIGTIDTLDVPESFSLSHQISTALGKDYSAISKLFSQHEGVTLEQYFIQQKIEKAKELLFYNEFTIGEISVKLGYKSVQHFSTQFRNITGFTPSEFKKLKDNRRTGVDKI